MRIHPFASIALGCSLLVACGGNNNNGTDARVTDSGGSADAPPPDARVQVRDGVLAVTQINLTDPGFTSYGGASISLEFDDLTKGDGGMKASGTLGNCTVYTFDVGASATHTPHPPIDEATITIDGDGLAEPGPYQCASSSGAYTCVGETQANRSGTYTVTNSAQGAQVDLADGARTFMTKDIGKYISMTGFPDAGMNHVYPIVSVFSGAAVIAIPPVNPNNTPPVVPDTANKSYSAAGYSLLQGVGPVPGGASTVNFLDLGSTAAPKTVTVTMAGNTDYPDGISASLIPIGKNMILDGADTGGSATCPDCASPNQFPFTLAAGQSMSISCDPAQGDGKGNCGDESGVTGTVVTGFTTDATIAGAAAQVPYLMPAPVAHYATFTCTFPVQPTGKVKATIPHDALAAILATNPTRVETRFFRFAFIPPTADSTSLNTYAVVTGHGLVGHTTKQ